MSCVGSSQTECLKRSLCTSISFFIKSKGYVGHVRVTRHVFCVTIASRIAITKGTMLPFIMPKREDVVIAEVGSFGRGICCLVEQFLTLTIT